jgi:RimJ/RimL family protein N-acetyltransferase
MKSQHLSISFAEFKQMPHPFGWKAEYYNDQAHFTPRSHVIKTNLNIQASVIKSDFLIQPIDLQYKQEMTKAFYQSFRNSIEFCDWTTQEIRKHAEKNITDYFAGARGVPLPQSVMALEPKTKQLIGLALFVITKKQRYKLDLLFVKPDYQKQGLAASMVSQVTGQLHEMGIGELYSLYHIGNEASRNWHQKFGFKEEYDAHFSRLKYAWYCEEINRQEKLGLMDALPELIQQRDFWYAQLADENVQQNFWWENE